MKSTLSTLIPQSEHEISTCAGALLLSNILTPLPHTVIVRTKWDESIVQTDDWYPNIQFSSRDNHTASAVDAWDMRGLQQLWISHLEQDL